MKGDPIMYRLPGILGLTTALFAFLVSLTCFVKAPMAFDLEYEMRFESNNIWAFYVGNTNTDIGLRIYGDPAKTTKVTLTREDTEIFSKTYLPGQTVFPVYRIVYDAGLVKGSVVPYTLTIKTEWTDDEGIIHTTTYMENTLNVIPGQVHGIITRNITWTGGTWTIGGGNVEEFRIDQGAILTISPATTVIYDSESPLNFNLKGGFHAEGAVFHARLDIRADTDDHSPDYASSAFYMKNCVISGATTVIAQNSPCFESNRVIGDAWFSFRHNPVFQNNSISGGTFYIFISGPMDDELKISGWEFPEGEIHISGVKNLIIENSILEYIEVRGEPYLDGGVVRISNNLIKCNDDLSGIIKVSGIGSNDIYIEKNTFESSFANSVILLSAFKGDGEIGQRVVRENRGVRNITLGGNTTNPSDAVSHVLIENNSIIDDGGILSEGGTGFGISIQHGSFNTIITNSIIRERSFPHFWPGGGIGLGYNGDYPREEVSNNTIEANTIKNYKIGILLDTSCNNRIYGNSIENNDYGIVLSATSDNLITRNRLKWNAQASIYMGEYLGLGHRLPQGNQIYDNIFISASGRNVTGENWGITEQLPNAWNQEKQEGQNITRGTYLGGNYWNDYEGHDTDRDGIGDSSYIITSNNTDEFPLVLETVNSTGDSPDANINDGVCDTGRTITRDEATEPECTLRAAIMQASWKPRGGTIYFDIPGDNIPVIAPQSTLPIVASGVIIDGTTQPESGMVKLLGDSAGDTDGLFAAGSEIIISGLIIEGFAGNGLKYEPSVGGSLILSMIEIRRNKEWGIYQSKEISSEPIVIIDAIINGNAGGGIYTRTGIGLGSVNVIIAENGGDGIFDAGFETSQHIFLHKSSIYGNRGDGIKLMDSGGSVFFGGDADTHGLISNNEGNGISCNGNVITGYAEINGNNGDGINCSGVGGTILTHTTVHGNEGTGVSSINGIYCQEAKIYQNKGHGIMSFGEGPLGFSIIMNNSYIFENANGGILSENGNVIITSSMVYSNGKDGISITDGDLEARDIVSDLNDGAGLYASQVANIERGEFCGNQENDILVEGETDFTRVVSGDLCRNVEFDGDSSAGTAPFTVTFNDQTDTQTKSSLGAGLLSESGPGIIAREWDFGDGDSSTEISPTHTYKQPGVYTVVLKITTDDGLSHTGIKSGYIMVNKDCETDSDCDDGIWCNGAERCDNGVCMDGDLPCPDDGEFCTGMTYCDEENDQCVITESPCTGASTECDELKDICVARPGLDTAIICLGIITGIPSSDPFFNIEDVNGNNKIDMADLIYVLQKTAGIIP